ncbi:hypothetical protein ASPWEDRAFT_24090 [Aspergillus wentii DTO 134E9]|uniref:C2H2-type domain-containing protein n=1 Tax=Aspergillus wentii DTO 134E9 TaxID=1073089 RepID=A0A1L9RT34_ASPWE|nr:uncharacterized protein ASPWEDRAFT_24090 [Aspergillus wentii DTO 134E9]KAI9933781.1 hypothetical protein MW887_004853 [Aspergillus wentii]OJJ38126.1 hypothetical protein ASPWEDRAFT_24090 [Aspergillus wentii DTO 134E9]
MGTALDALTSPPQPLNSRRPAAPTLPSFELPPPNFQIGSGVTPKFLSQSNVHPPPNVSVGNLLTPPATTQPGESISPVQAKPPTTATTAAAAAVSAADLPSSYASAYWPGQSPYGGPSGTAARHSWTPGANASYPPREAYHTSLNQLTRNPATSGSSAEAMSQPYDMHQLPPFQQSLSVSSPNVTGPAIQHQQAMAHAMMSAHGAPPPNATSSHQLTSNDPYAGKSHSAPIYGSTPQIQNPQQAGYIYGQSGLGMHPTGRMAPATSPADPSTAQPQLGYRQPWPSYSLPAMPGPVKTNLHSPNSHMSYLSGMPPVSIPREFNSGYAASMQQMYGSHQPPGHGATAVSNDRPFKCDQCPQSFNRNHDLKRHKRIHLSVKPFPCTHCDKSFSRKDALKRHILVKGCGKETSSDGASSNPPSIKHEGGGAAKES